MVGNCDEYEFSFRSVQFLDSGLVEVFGVRRDGSMECNTFFCHLGLFDLLLDDIFDGGKVILDFDGLILFVERSNHFGDLAEGDHGADFGVKDGLKDVVGDVASELEAKLSSEDGIDLGLVDELLADSLEVLEEVLGDIDFVLLFVVSVGLEPVP